jgi:hypothetical protein
MTFYNSAITISSFEGVHQHRFDDLDYFFIAPTCEPNIGACDDAEIVGDICAQV